MSVHTFFEWKEGFFLQFAEVIDDDVQYIWIKEPTSTKLSVCNAVICSLSLLTLPPLVYAFFDQ